MLPETSRAPICRNVAPAAQNIVIVIAMMMPVVPRSGWSMSSSPIALMMTMNGIRPCSKLRRLSPRELSHAAR